MSVIWKFPVPVEGEFSIEMPSFAHVLCVQTQKGEPHLWAHVDPSRATEQRRFRIFGTGQPITEEAGYGLSYIGTFQMENSDLVFHLYELEELPF